MINSYGLTGYSKAIKNEHRYCPNVEFNCCSG